MFSWNYYVERALNWIETIIGFIVSISIVVIPVGFLFYLLRNFLNNVNKS